MTRHLIVNTINFNYFQVIFVTGVAGSGVDVLVRALKKVEGSFL